MHFRTVFFLCLALTLVQSCGGGSGGGPSTSHSAAREWNEVLLESIRNDFARPTVHARNLFHISAAMYDAWAAYDSEAETYLLGKTLNEFDCAHTLADSVPPDVEAAREAAISYAAYRLIRHRFARSPGAVAIRQHTDLVMASFGYDTAFTGTDTSAGNPAALGNRIAECYIAYGLQDGSNEHNEYANQHYSPVNPTIQPEQPGNPDIVDLDRWQPIELTQFIDQAGNPVTGVPPFLSPEWGRVLPFALQEADRTDYSRDDFTYPVYFDPGPPPGHSGPSAPDYQWSFSLVAVWSSHLAPDPSVVVDISPNSLGNVDLDALPAHFSDYPDFYDLFNGGDPSPGYDLNPVTGQAYAEQIVPLGDYTRVLAEFWADGPDSETPPGHWFVLLNDVADHPDFEPRWQGSGEALSRLEWDVKAYFALGGAMHDVAVTIWGIKGWYDYLRPISAIRGMAELGQSSDPLLPSYHEHGLPLYPGYIALVNEGDPLAGANDEHVGKIKLLAWRGPDFIDNPATDVAGVGWILAENWWPYQRPSFVSPPFAGYLSGHSTYSRAAAEVLSAITGSEYFPGGLAEYRAARNQFLVFEEGPSVDVVLQWAKYSDAADQCSLSRIWGGIHPPVDDLKGRLIGRQIGRDAFAFAQAYFSP